MAKQLSIHVKTALSGIGILPDWIKTGLVDSVGIAQLMHKSHNFTIRFVVFVWMQQSALVPSFCQDEQHQLLFLPVLNPCLRGKLVWQACLTCLSDMPLACRCACVLNLTVWCWQSTLEVFCACTKSLKINQEWTFLTLGLSLAQGVMSMLASLINACPWIQQQIMPGKFSKVWFCLMRQWWLRQTFLHPRCYYQMYVSSANGYGRCKKWFWLKTLPVIFMTWNVVFVVVLGYSIMVYHTLSRRELHGNSTTQVQGRRIRTVNNGGISHGGGLGK